MHTCLLVPNVLSPLSESTEDFSKVWGESGHGGSIMGELIS